MRLSARVGALLAVLSVFGARASAQVAGPGPTFPQRGALFAERSNGSRERRELEEILEAERRRVIRISDGAVVWPVRLRAEMDCAATAGRPGSVIAHSDSVAYVFVPTKVVVDSSGLWATETGSLFTSPAASSGPKNPAAEYLRVWKRRDSKWFVFASCAGARVGPQ